MRFFVCVLDRMGHGISDEARRTYESLARSRGIDYAWQLFPHAALLTAWDDAYGDALVAKDGDDIAIGTVRLDNRRDIEQWAELHGEDLTDLELVLHLVVRRGVNCIARILGDFAFVVYNAGDLSILAAADALGTKRLYYIERDGFVAFASRAEALAVGENYEEQYLAEMVALGMVSPGLTVYAGVHRLPAGAVAVLGRVGFNLSTYWSADEVVTNPLRPQQECEASETCRCLLADAIQYRLASNGNTWAQLSGGLDSSSIVSMTQWLAERGVIPHGLSGTITFVDSQNSDADEREYSIAVVNRWQVRNEVIVDCPLWFDEPAAPPRIDQPTHSLAFYPRDRRLCAIVRSAGGRVLLAGFGGDEAFTGTTLFFSDWLVQGRVWMAVRELARWAAAGRVSFWALAYGNALMPLLPIGLRNSKPFDQGLLPPWISPAAVKRYELHARAPGLTPNRARTGRKYRDALIASLNEMISQLDAGAIGDVLDVRYPFLYRPLVEFALSLPPELCARPHARKWILRQAMLGILPEIVRTRVGKGASTDVLVRSLTAQRSFLEPLTVDPILADLGVVDPDQLRFALDTAPHGAYGQPDLCTDVQNTLMVEAWLRMRSGRWLQGPS